MYYYIEWTEEEIEYKTFEEVAKQLKEQLDIKKWMLVVNNGVSFPGTWTSKMLKRELEYHKKVLLVSTALDTIKISYTD